MKIMEKPNQIQRHYCRDLKDLVVSFTDFSTSVLRNALACHEKISLVVPGGNTPRFYLPSLGQQLLRWQDVTVTLSDERWVDIDTNTSNEALVKKYFLSHMPAHFVGLKTSHDSPLQAINTICQRLSNLPQPFSLTILGLGEDGHIASLFPGLNLTLQTMRWCLAVQPPVAPSLRISLSLNALANSQVIVFAVTGATKRLLLDRLIDTYPDPDIPFVWLMQQSSASIIVFETDAILMQ